MTSKHRAHREAVETTVECTSCKRPTGRIVVEVSRVDWSSFWFVGIWTILFPSLRRKEFQCEHCGKSFVPPTPPMRRCDRIIGFILGGFFLALLVLAFYIVRSVFQAGLSAR